MLVAATAIVTWIAASYFNTPSREEIIAAQVVADHSRSMITSRLTDVASSDQHTVKPWLSSKLDFSPPVSDLTTAGFPLVGGRVEYLDNRPVAALVYKHRQHVIDLFIWPASETTRTAARALGRQGYQVMHWQHDGMTFWAVSDLNAADLKSFVETFSQATP
jgi:anti-sigma factor RsiW